MSTCISNNQLTKQNFNDILKNYVTSPFLKSNNNNNNNNNASIYSFLTEISSIKTTANHTRVVIAIFHKHPRSILRSRNTDSCSVGGPTATTKGGTREKWPGTYENGARRKRTRGRAGGMREKKRREKKRKERKRKGEEEEEEKNESRKRCRGSSSNEVRSHVKTLRIIWVAWYRRPAAR